MTIDLSNFAKAVVDPVQVAGGIGGSSVVSLVSPITPASPFTPSSSGTPNIVTLSPPNDGFGHYFFCTAVIVVASAMTGGGIHPAWTQAGSAQGPSFFSAQATPGTYYAYCTGAVDAGTTFRLDQATAMTAGSAQYTSVRVFWF